MKSGSKEQLDKLTEEQKKEIIWTSKNYWVLVEPHDPEHVKKRFEQARLVDAGISPAPVKPPPSFFSKVKSYWKATTGPKVEQEEFDRRYSKCTAEAGATWSTLSGKVENVQEAFITVNGKGIALASDEKPSVQVGNTVEEGQTIAISETVKPCPYLVVKNNSEFCGACGCGKRTTAELSTKLWFKNVECPRTPKQF